MAINNISLENFEVFSTRLFEKMKFINPGIEDLELYEFQYALKNLYTCTRVANRAAGRKDRD